MTAHQDLVARCRAAEGCLDAVIVADPVDPGRINVLERWESQADLDAWRAVANAPDLDVEIDAAAVQLFTVTDARPPFG